MIRLDHTLRREWKTEWVTARSPAAALPNPRYQCCLGPRQPLPHTSPSPSPLTPHPYAPLPNTRLASPHTNLYLSFPVLRLTHALCFNSYPPFPPLLIPSLCPPVSPPSFHPCSLKDVEQPFTRHSSSLPPRDGEYHETTRRFLQILPEFQTHLGKVM